MDSLAVKNPYPTPTLSIQPIARVESPFTRRGAIPRQSGLIPDHRDFIVFRNTSENILMLRGIEDFSHIWVLFWIHNLKPKRNTQLVDPPRSIKPVGTLASRSPYRPNPIGLSVVTLHDIAINSESIKLEIGGSDLLNKTPVLDIKPYIPYADSHPDALASWASEKPATISVQWTECAIKALYTRLKDSAPRIQRVISDIISHDPRPFHKKGTEPHAENLWKCSYHDMKILWKIEDGQAIILELQDEKKTTSKEGFY